ncbi:hypothetical protein [Chitinophaga defluvii]|uniref:Uncharacterized protein n=1 Tax=Chitinophaga defluvii TaxID=3163343 RepID=A0ABV2T6F0_9BACT
MKSNPLVKDALLFVAAVLLVGVLHALKKDKHTTTYGVHHIVPGDDTEN